MSDTRRLWFLAVCALLLFAPTWLSESVIAQGDTAAVAAEDATETDDDRRRGGTSTTKAAPVDPLIPESWTTSMPWRSIGPANMGGRITAISVYEKDPSIWWAATASGGLLKTTNNGVTLEHQFDKEATVSIGDVQVAQSDPNIVWVGTGEPNPRNSVSWGDGVYKSTDGGKTWTNMGLGRTFQIGRLAIHPKNPDVVYVGALGRLYGENPQRGLFKTTDGGKTWKKIHYIDAKTGVIDLKMKPDDPDTILMATYERQRDGFDTNDPAKKWGAGSALWKTTDGGNTWKKLTKGLPSGLLGRIGIDWYHKDPNVAYVILESDKIGLYPKDAPYVGIRGSDAEVGVKLTRITRESPADKAGLQRNDIVLEVDGTMVHSMKKVDEAIWTKKAGDKLTFKVVRDKKSQTIEVTLGTRPAPRNRRRGNRNFSSRPLGTRLGGQRANVQMQQGENGHEYGGIYRSDDAGETWKRINSINPRPMYFSSMRVDPMNDKYLYVCGVQLSRSKDHGKTFTSDGGRGVHADQHAIWINPNDGEHMILGCDGGIYVTYDRMNTWDHLNHVAIGQFYHVGVGPGKEYRVYGGLQDNGSWGGPVHVRNDRGPTNADWFRIGGGDGFWCLVDPRDPDQLYLESQNGNMRRVNLRTGEQRSIRPGSGRGGRGGRGRGRAGGRRQRTRFNWETPFVLSAENPQVFYTAGNKVFRSVAKGDRLVAISPNITKGDRGSGSALAESRRDPNVLWVGTDDGALWMTRDGGTNWTDMFTSKRVNTAEAAAAEAEAAEERPATADAAGSATEAPARTGPSRFMLRMIERLKKADKNGDGKVAKAEINERQMRWFRRIDKNEDGVLDEAEFKAAAGAAKKATTATPATQRRPRTRRGPRRPTAADRPEVAEASAAEMPAPEMPVKSAPAKKTKPASTNAAEEAKPAAAKADDGPDRISGRWTGAAQSEMMRGGNLNFTFDLKRGANNALTGRVQSRMGSGELSGGRYDPKNGRVTFSFSAAGGRSMEFAGTVKGDQLNGTVEMGGGMFSMDVETTKSKKAAQVAEKAAVPTSPRPRPRARKLRDLVKKPMWVSEVVASRHRTSRAFVAFDGHRSDVDRTHVYMTDNFGRTWTDLGVNLPANAGAARTIAEDIKNPDVLYLGLEFGAWFSVDRGATWTKFRGKFPTVAVHAFAQHETEGDMVVGTHGRSLWVLDVTPIRQLTMDALKKDAVLLAPNDATIWRSRQRRGVTNRRFVGDNRPSTASIYYVLGKKAEKISLEVFDWKDNLVKTLTAKADVGLHRVEWNLSRDRRGGQGARRGGRFGRFRGGRRVSPDRYKVVLTVNGERQVQPIQVSVDPGFVDGEWLANEAENDVEENEEEENGSGGEENGDR